MDLWEAFPQMHHASSWSNHLIQLSLLTASAFISRLFWPEKPTVCFVQLKGQFASSNIVQDATKFYHIISQLDNKHMAAHTTTNARISLP
jgi:hypothetical protein